MIQIKQRRCKGTSRAIGFGCGELFTPTSTLHKGLCNKCYPKWLYSTPAGKDCIEKSTLKAKKIIHTEQVKKSRAEKKEIMTKSEYEAMLQSIVNSIVRMTDIERGCISCECGWHGKPFTRQRHAGHRYSIGSTPALRFDMFNVYGQCSICNNYLSGNETNYDKGIIEHHGKEYITILEQHKLKYQELKLTISELSEAISKATEVKKQLQKGKYFGREEINQMIGIYIK
jgi:hypothetical protein